MISNSLFVIAMVPRSGSTFLSELVNALLGNSNPTQKEDFNIQKEDFNYDLLVELFDQDLLKLAEGCSDQSREARRSVVANVLRKMERTDQEHVVLKINWLDYLVWLYRDQDLLPKSINWVFLDRRDQIAQAHSLAKALKIGTWHSPAVATRGEDQVRVNLEELTRSLRVLNENRYGWNTFFGLTKFAVEPIWYEQLMENPQEVATSLLVGKGIVVNDLISWESMTVPTSDDHDKISIEKLRIQVLVSELQAHSS